MKRDRVKHLNFIAALSIALSASLMSFEYREFEHFETTPDYDWSEPIEQDTMIVVKYEKIPELPKPKKISTAPKPKPEPIFKPDPSKIEIGVDIDTIDWFEPEPYNEPDPVFVPTLSYASQMPSACDCAQDDPNCTELYMMRHFANNLVYPRKAKDDGVSGTVYVNFIIDEKGKVTDIKTRNKVHPDLEAEAVRVVSTLGCFTPGKQGDKKVRIMYTAPIQFRLGL